MKRAALYLRVSTEEQTTANQRPELERIARARDLTIATVYEETISATKRRPAYDAMMKAAHAGDFEVLIIWALDRFGRSMVGNLEDVLALDRRRVMIISARESWLEVAGPARELLIGVFSWVAEQERARLIERTCAGLERARAQGKQIGRPRVIDGIGRQARFLLSKPGATCPAVARELGVSESSVRRALRKQAKTEQRADFDRGSPVSKGGASGTPPRGPKTTSNGRS